MDISEVRRHFTAYGSGELPEGELRNSIREALMEDPDLSPTFVALADAYRRANLIDAHLESAIIADITEVTGPKTALTMIRPPRAASQPYMAAPHLQTMSQPRVAQYASPSTLPHAPGSTTGSSWDMEERLAEVATA